MARRPTRMAVVLLVVLGLILASGTASSAAIDTDALDDDASFETIAELDELTSDHARLFRLYWAFFGRSPDAGGAIYWIGQYEACHSLDAIAGHFAASSEFADRYGELDDEAFVDLAYRQVLDRAPDADGGVYWRGLLGRRVLTRGGVMLQVSLSSEFVDQHRYPSDDVPGRSCSGSGGTTSRSIDNVEGEPLATVAGLTIIAPSALVERAGFHQSSHPGALAMTPTDPAPTRLTTMSSRNRGTDLRGAIDIVTEPSTAITAPVSGTVDRAGDYTLYCKYRDGYVVINPDGRPDLEVKILHIQNVAVRAGDRVEVGDRLADHATTFPFESQIDALTGEPSWPHVHIEVVDPSISRKSSSSGSC